MVIEDYKTQIWLDLKVAKRIAKAIASLGQISQVNLYEPKRNFMEYEIIVHAKEVIPIVEKIIGSTDLEFKLITKDESKRADKQS